MRTAKMGSISVFVAIILASLQQPTLAHTNTEDVEGLRLFYTSLNSPLLTGWNVTAGDPCRDSWQGLTCDTDGRNVTQIELPGLALNGTLGWSSSLDKFKHLTVLDLSNNQLKGVIPYNLPINIKLLNLQRNHLMGNIPWSVGQLLSLTEMRLAHNNFTGPITDNFTKLHCLITMDLSDNSFTGSIPRSLHGLSNLSFLYLQENQIDRGLDILAGLRLHTLDIRKNAFKGEEIPKRLMSVPSFQFSANEFNFSLSQDQFSLQSPAPSPAAHTPTSYSSEEALIPLPAQETAVAPTAGDQPIVSDVRSRDGRESASFWYPERVAGATVVSILAMVAFVLTCLYCKWKHLEEEPRREHQKEDCVMCHGCSSGACTPVLRSSQREVNW